MRNVLGRKLFYWVGQISEPGPFEIKCVKYFFIILLGKLGFWEESVRYFLGGNFSIWVGHLSLYA